MIKKITENLTLLLSIPMFRIIIGKLRFLYFYKIKGNLQTIESVKAVPNTISHNLKSLSKFGFTRMDKIIKPISVI